MNPALRIPGLLLCLLCVLGLSTAAAQPPPGGTPAATPSATAPASAPADRQPITARVLEVQGDVQHAPLGSDAWQPARVGDEYPAETMIRTGIRSGVKLQVGSEEPYTALVIESATKTILSEAYRTAGTKRVRVGVGYGRIRAGVAEGGLQSEFTVDSPVATLSKRGTWDFGIFYERGTDRFEVFLLDRGLVDVLNELTQQRRELQPGERVTQAMRRWADEAQLVRNVPVVDILGQSDIQIAFNRLREEGLGVLDPAGGRSSMLDLSTAAARQEFAQLARQGLGTSGPLIVPPTTPPATFLRAEGFFGTGRGDDLIPVMIEAGSSLAQKGLARPGQYQFRRAALESWLAKHGGR